MTYILVKHSLLLQEYTKLDQQFWNTHHMVNLKVEVIVTNQNQIHVMRYTLKIHLEMDYVVRLELEVTLFNGTGMF